VVRTQLNYICREEKGLGFFRSLFRSVEKSIGRELKREQSEIQKMEKELGVRLDHSSYREFNTDAEYQAYRKNEQQKEEMMLDRLLKKCNEILKGFSYFEQDYLNGRITKDFYLQEWESVHEELKKEIFSKYSSIDPNGYLSGADKMDLYEDCKSILDDMLGDSRIG
jgi:hypothetical protein